VIGEAVVALVGEDEMVQHDDAEQFRSLPESVGEHTIFLAWGDITRGVLVLCDVSNYVEFLHTDASAPA
jgi:hypothetical protein